MDWSDLILPALTGALAYAGAFAAVRVDIKWIKKALARHEGEIDTLHARINRLRESK